MNISQKFQNLKQKKRIRFKSRKFRFFRNNFFLSLSLFCSGCHYSEKNNEEKKDKIYVLSTIAMIGNLVSEIGKDHINSVTLIKGELDPHSYELVKGDDEKFARADVIFANGLGLEHGYTLKHNLDNNPKVKFLGDAFVKNCPEVLIKIDNQYDPHIWMDIALWSMIVDPIADVLCLSDPIHSSEYRRNALLLKEKMLNLNQKTYEDLQMIDDNCRYLVTSHNAFNYFVKHYFRSQDEEHWQSRLIAPEGLSPEAELSSRDLMRVLNFVTENNIFVLFAESNVNKDPLKKIVSSAHEKGLNLRIAKECLYVDSMGKKNSYLEMMEHNVITIINELKNRNSYDR